jgi:hypothetical protein
MICELWKNVARSTFATCCFGLEVLGISTMATCPVLPDHLENAQDAKAFFLKFDVGTGSNDN